MYGYGCFISANGKIPSGVAIDADAQSFFTATGITDLTQKNAVNQLVLDLKSANIWTKMVELLPIVGGNSTKHSYNLVNPSLYQLTYTSGWSHSSTGQIPTSAYANTGLDLSVLGQNSFSMGFYSRTNNSGTKATMGANDNNSTGSVIIATNSGLTYFNVNDSWNTTPSNYLTRTDGLITINRSSSGTKKIYRNGSLMGSVSNSSTTPLTLPIYLGNTNQNNTSLPFPDNKECCLYYVSSGMSDAEHSTLYTIVQTFQTSLSRNV